MNQNNEFSAASERLQSFVEGLESLIADRRDINAEIAEVKARAKSEGFDVKTITRILKLRELSKQERDEQDALLDLYKASLGMLGGTPLGEAARKRTMKPPPPESDGADEGEDETGAEEPAPDENDDPNAEESAGDGGLSEADIDAAREKGRQAALDGAKVLSNPYVAGDPRRAAWDEGWCAGAGSDGMDLPAAWRPTKKPKKKKGGDK